MIAVFENGGKQYQVKVGDKVSLESIDKKEGEEIEIHKVLLSFDKEGKEIEVGKPFTGNVVTAKILEQGKSDKVSVYKMKAKKRYSVNRSHRQPYTKVEIISIS